MPVNSLYLPRFLPSKTSSCVRSAVLLLAVLLLQPLVQAAEYWVSKAGNDTTGDGSQANPWLTIGKAARLAVGGDVVRIVGPGTYNERVTPSNSGRDGSYITFKGESMPVVAQGFNCNKRNFIRIVGVEITPGPSSGTVDVIQLNGTNYQIMDCYIHETYGIPIRTAYSADSSAYCNNVVVRSNYIRKPGITAPDDLVGQNGIQLAGTNIVVEYNRLEYCSDYMWVSGVHVIIRNNVLAEMPAGGLNPDPHVDGWQTHGSGDRPVCDVWMERNFCVTNVMANSHGWWLNGTDATNIFRRITVRGNLIHQLGSYVAMFSYAPEAGFYNNTISYAGSVARQSGLVNVSTSSTNSVVQNNIFYGCNQNNGGTSLYLANQFTNSYHGYDLIHSSGAVGDAGTGLLTNDPLFSNAASLDFALQAVSPAIGSAGALALTTAAGTSTTTVPLDKARLFTDGAGIVEGDKIVVGTNAATRITGIDYAVGLVTLANAVTYTSGASVFLDGTQDRGALPYFADGYKYGIAWLSPLNGQVVSGSTTLQVTVINEAVVRCVDFLVDGIPVARLYDPPWRTSYTFGSGSHKLEARAYPLYPTTILAERQQIQLNLATAPLPTPPAKLRANSNASP